MRRSIVPPHIGQHDIGRVLGKLVADVRQLQRNVDMQKSLLDLTTTSSQTITAGGDIARTGWSGITDGWTSVGSGVYAAKFAGIYHIAGVASVDAQSGSNTRFYLQVQVNGVTVFSNSKVAGNRQESLTFAFTKALAADDEVAIRVGASGTNLVTASGVGTNVFSAAKIR